MDPTNTMPSQSESATPQEQHVETSSTPKPSTGLPKALQRQITTDHGTTALTTSAGIKLIPGDPKSSADRPKPDAATPVPAADHHVRAEDAPSPSPSQTMMPRSKAEYIPTPPIDIPQYVRWTCEDCHMGYYFPQMQCGSCAHIYCSTCKAYETYDFKSLGPGNHGMERMGLFMKGV